MNCAEMQEKIALFVGGDLAHEEAAEVSAHLAVCGACRVVEQELSDARAMLLSLRTVADDEVATVHENVLRKVARRRRPVLAWLPYAAAVAALVFGWTAMRPLPEPEPLSVSLPRIVPPEIVRLVKSRERQRAVTPVRRRPTAPPKQEEEVVVTLFTDDPDVVIVWITD